MILGKDIRNNLEDNIWDKAYYDVLGKVGHTIWIQADKQWDSLWIQMTNSIGDEINDQIFKRWC